MRRFDAIQPRALLETRQAKEVREWYTQVLGRTEGEGWARVGRQKLIPLFAASHSRI